LFKRLHRFSLYRYSAYSRVVLLMNEKKARIRNLELFRDKHEGGGEGSDDDDGLHTDEEAELEARHYVGTGTQSQDYDVSLPAPTETTPPLVGTAPWLEGILYGPQPQTLNPKPAAAGSLKKLDPLSLLGPAPTSSQLMSQQVAIVPSTQYDGSERVSKKRTLGMDRLFRGVL
jgi:hypothetical protein